MNLRYGPWLAHTDIVSVLVQSAGLRKRGKKRGSSKLSLLTWGGFF